MNFILPHSFELDLRRECHYLVHRSFSFGVIQIRRSVQKLSSLGSPSADLFEREGFYFTDCSVIRFIDAQERLLLLCFYTGEASRLWWASVLLLSEPRQSVRTVRVPYRPSVFAPFCLKSAGLALIWASAVLLWFLALLYTRGRGLSIRRMHNELDTFFQEMTKKLYCSYKRATETASLRSLDGPQGLLWETSAQELPDFFRAIFRCGEQNARWAYILYYKQVILLNKDKLLIKKISWIAHLTAIWILYTRYTWSV